MTNYNDGKWHGWNGGVCPVHPETVVEVVLHDDTDGDRPLAHFKPNETSVPAKRLTGCWEHRTGLRHIIAFRIIKEHKVPREVWMMWWDSEGYWLDCDPNTKGAVLFREVLE